MSPFNSPLVQRRSVVSRSSDYWECSGDDSGFVDIIEFRNQLDHNLSVSERGTHNYDYMKELMIVSHRTMFVLLTVDHLN